MDPRKAEREQRLLLALIGALLVALVALVWFDVPFRSPFGSLEERGGQAEAAARVESEGTARAHAAPPPAGHAWVLGRLALPANSPEQAHPRVVFVETPGVLASPEGALARPMGDGLAFGPLALVRDSNHLVLARVGLAVLRKGFLVQPGQDSDRLDLGILQLSESPTIELVLLGDEELALEIAHVEGTLGSEAFLLSDAGAWALGPRTTVKLRPGVSYLLAPFTAEAMYEMALVDKAGRRSAALRAATREISSVRVDLDPASIER